VVLVAEVPVMMRITRSAGEESQRRTAVTA
jgi:hypothetical protein